MPRAPPPEPKPPQKQKKQLEMDKKELKEQQKRENEMRKKFQVGGPGLSLSVRDGLSVGEERSAQVHLRRSIRMS